MYKVYKPLHIGSEYYSSILFKVCPNWKHLMDFVEGRFYMNTNAFFSNIETS